MKRKDSRESAFLAEFELTFGHSSLDELLETVREEGEYGLDDFAESLLRLYEQHSFEVDEQIRAHLKGWSDERLSKTSLSLLRLSIAEMLYGEPDMDSVIINEAVELAKRYAGEKDYQFVNGLLGTVSRDRAAEKAACAEPAAQPAAAEPAGQSAVDAAPC